jgi:hypothetical protein
LDGCLLLNETLKLMRPDVQTNVYAKLAKIRTEQNNLEKKKIIATT